ncbi:hypothetical protein Q669_20605 [Labrenzia sp. C1B10]|nr:hypothetical protein Q669_20605 [Labrenzia sp. C1B10]
MEQEEIDFGWSCTGMKRKSFNIFLRIASLLLLSSLPQDGKDGHADQLLQPGRILGRGEWMHL